MMPERIIQLKRNSPISRLNPALKIIYLLIIFLLTMLFNHPLPLLILLIMLILISIPGGVIKNIFKLLSLIIIITVFTIIIWNLTLKGNKILIQYGHYIIYKDVLLYSTGMVIRIADAIIAGVIILSTTSIEDLHYGLKKILITSRLTFAFVYALILLPNIFGTLATVELAQRARGFSPKGRTIFKGIQKYVPLLTPTLLYTIKNAGHISMALESKAFGYTKNAVFIKEYRIRITDIVLISIFTIIIIFSIYLRFLGYGVVMNRL
jgi:energy-coupling factor transport system permease protein